MKGKVFSLHTDRYYSPTDILYVLNEAVNPGNVKKNRKGAGFFNVPCSFDIETSSFYRDEDGNTYTYEQSMLLGDKRKGLEKCSTMYIWQFGINGYRIVGRTWSEFIEMCNVIAEALELTEDLKLIIYVHNLSYEFQFIRNMFNWSKVFSIDERKPIYATTDKGLEFRCSYLLSGYSLSKLGDQLHKYKCHKMDGDLDYTLIRHTSTPLTDTEMGYCLADIDVVMCYIQERIEECKGIGNIPLTKTGFVRKHCRSKCLRHNVNGKVVRNWGYINMINELKLSGLEEFDALQRAFAGGFTHANAYYSDTIQKDVDSYDFTSSYPYVMVSERFPMSKGCKVQVENMEQFHKYISKYCCIFDIEFTNLCASQTSDNPLSVSKCMILEDGVENNGRVVMCARAVTTITEVDFEIFSKFYTWTDIRIGTMYCYKRGYLPTEFVSSILDLYESKTKLKGVEGMEVEYLNSKEMLNSCYGMSVTNPLRDEIVYNGAWDIAEMSDEDKAEALFKYNNSENRFLYYPWGVYVTAYARRNLFTGILECGDDFIYADTDSVKIKNGDNHKPYFDAYNVECERKLREACAYHGIDYSKCSPCTIKGKHKPLGVWDYEGRYRRFKTLGAKRYMVEEDNALKVDGKSYNFSLTVSGVNKKTAIPFLVEKYGGENIFRAFSNYLEIPPEAAGKNIHTYIDYEIEGSITDYMGNTSRFHELNGVHLEPTGYTLSLSARYLDYLQGIKLKE